MLSFEEARKKLETKHIPHVILLCGNEPYFMTNIRQHILDNISSEYEVETISYDLKETPIQDVIIDAETYPFFGEKKVIIAENAVFLKSKPDKLLFEHDLKKLEKYVSDAVGYTYLILVAPFEKIDERKKVVKALRSHAMAISCHAIKEYNVSEWIKTMAEQFKINLNNEAIELLASELSTDLGLIKNELTKLSLYVGEGGLVTKEVAESLVAHNVNQSSSRLVEAVMERNLHKAVEIYRDLEKMKEEPIAIVALLAYQFRMMMQVKLLKAKGYNQFQIQKHLKVHPYVIKIAYKREKYFDLFRLKDILNKLTNTDASIKQGKMEKRIAFELLLYDLIQPA